MYIYYYYNIVYYYYCYYNYHYYHMYIDFFSCYCCWHPSVSEDNGFAPWSSFRGLAATATVAVEPNSRAADLLAGRALRLCRPRYPMLPSLVCAASSSRGALSVSVLFLSLLILWSTSTHFGQQPRLQDR